jgi:type I restriction enzyme S subunit
MAGRYKAYSDYKDSDKKWLKRYSRGITDFRLRLYWEEFKCVEVPVPPEEDIAEILKQIQSLGNQYDHLIQVAVEQINLLQERRTALISAAVPDKIDVRDWTAPEGET